MKGHFGNKNPSLGWPFPNSVAHALQDGLRPSVCRLHPVPGGGKLLPLAELQVIGQGSPDSISLQGSPNNPHKQAVIRCFLACPKQPCRPGPKWPDAFTSC